MIEHQQTTSQKIYRTIQRSYKKINDHYVVFKCTLHETIDSESRTLESEGCCLLSSFETSLKDLRLPQNDKSIVLSRRSP